MFKFRSKESLTKFFSTENFPIYDTHLLICGDFNLKDVIWSDYCGTTNSHHIEPFLDVVDSMFLFQHVTEPTRYRSCDTPCLLDLVFTNELDMISNISYFHLWVIVIMSALFLTWCVTHSVKKLLEISIM